MPENIFKQISPEILRLHRQTLHSLLATQGCRDCEIHHAVYITLNGLYYVWLPDMPSAHLSRAGILLIEDETSHTRLSWIADTRRIHRQDNLYRRISSALQRRMLRAKEKFHQAADSHLLELTPRQGRLTTADKDFPLSPHDLLKALYPASHKLGEFAL
ncbi:pyridoxamine 5'-phosphate oxidase family protein [Neisseria animalis]|uniref:Pyridoxamine 5'-phosphate oxidase family protein n=1 Tax=Neisseria animalis TaxID=492 RepID=A0A5P3MTI1_NEIAN|nr:pyridoxamine 5'-phosphate oxidase family protein [Neisseria animalis]QEY24770.1 pyridoxamine 5'-phosphate oxidase family protein [Neisseria animalis]ROW31829.1 pyridoxamine 5'-phosphate oxidase family protein [Neisseria animalis]VEE07749.1 putative lipoprotein [Neisseria animalis]